MSLDSGSQLGSYTIVGPLGAGGMGEVYRATDSKLDREVAIKVLPDAMAYDKERVARFEREAKVLAQLNHPRIAAIYGFDEAEGKRFLVLELVEGPTLADRLAAGRLPVEECLDIARQIAEALEVAHDKGIVHRDLKPANVKVTTEGEVKVLDFGLAKALAEDDTHVDSGDSPTITQNFTAPGVILGTAAYMSPEQARGRPVDKRADIWALGVVLYQCLTGDSIFRGETVTDSLGAILHKQPDWEQLPAETPPTVRLLLRRCLTKDRKRRLRDIGDVKIELEAAIADPTSSVLGLTNTALPIDRKAHWMGRGFAVNVGIALLAAVLTIVIGRSFWATAPAVEARPPAPVERFTITLPQRESKITVPVDYRTFSVANDGKVLVYMATKDPVGVNFFQRSLDQVEPVQIASSDKIRMPTLSPDGRWLAYHDNDQKTLLKKSIIGGPATTLCQDHDIVGITWADDGFITFTDFGRPNTLLRINEVGGEVTELKLSGSEERWTRIVHALPGGQAILYSAFEGQLSANRGSIGVFSLETGQAKQLIQDGIYPLYSQSGHLLFLRDSTLMAAPFDATTLEITGQVVPVPGLQKVSTGQWGNAYIDITDTGTLYYHEDREQASTLRGIYRYPLEGGGKPELISPRTGYFERFSISSDCRFIAVEIGEGRFNQNESIWVLDLERNVLQQVTTEPGPQVAPVISPDGRWIYYAAEGDDEEWSGLYRRQRGDHSIDGAELIDDGPRACYPISMSPDGKYLLVAEASDSKLSPETSWDIGLISLGEDGAKATRTVWAGGPEFEYEPKISPNGRHVAYSAWRIGSSKSDVYVRPLDSSVDGNSVYQVSINGGSDAMWSPDGKTIYYVESVDPNTPKKMMAAAVLDDTHQTTADGKLAKFAIGEVTELFDFSVFQGSREHLEIMPDGSGILRNDAVPQEGNEKAHDDPTVIHVVRNFFTELDRVAPTEEGRRE